MLIPRRLGLLLGLLVLTVIGCTPVSDSVPPPEVSIAASATPNEVAVAPSAVPPSPESTATPEVTVASAPTSTVTVSANAAGKTATPQGGSTINLPIVGVGSSPTVVPSATPAPPTVAPTQAATATPRPTRTPEPPRVMNLRSDLPAMGYADFPRPAGDNGRCMHWTRNQYFTEEDLNTNIPRLQQLGAKWVLVVYADENIIKMAAPRFAEAGITPIWLRMLRPFEAYYDWQRDVELVQSYGLPPYFQLYNEPSLGQEWTDLWEGEIEEDLFLDHLMQASRDVYNAGGYVGWQFVNPDWLGRAIDEVEKRDGTRIFERFFFVPHPYGENLPPDWTEDGRGVLSFTRFADQFRSRLGTVPVMIAGEGGWRINGQDEPRFPAMDEATHARYHVELFNWFGTGMLSNGQPLPDYLFAFCPWLIAEKGDDNAWWDSFAGDRLQTIQAVSAMPPFERKFSWE